MGEGRPRLKARFMAWILGMTVLLITGCGFHLRGMLEMPRWLNNMTIVLQNASRDLEPLLTNQLKTYNIRVNPDPARTDFWLIIEEDSYHQQMGSISSSTTPRQYQLYYTVRFKLQRSKGEKILPSTLVVVTRQITLNSDRILGSTYEEDLSKSEMRREAVMQIIQRLSRVHEH